MRGNPVFLAAACLDCFAALAMTKGVCKSCKKFLGTPLLPRIIRRIGGCGGHGIAQQVLGHVQHVVF